MRHICHSKVTRVTFLEFQGDTPIEGG
jgi:hypothetical protein